MALWIVQILLALIFVMASGMKPSQPREKLAVVGRRTLQELSSAIGSAILPPVLFLREGRLLDLASATCSFCSSRRSAPSSCSESFYCAAFSSPRPQRVWAGIALAVGRIVAPNVLGSVAGSSEARGPAPLLGYLLIFGAALIGVLHKPVLGTR